MGNSVEQFGWGPDIGGAVVIAFDLYNNGGQSVPNVGITVSGGSYVALSDNTVIFDNGNVWSCWVDYVGSSQSLQVRLNSNPVRPASPRIQATVNLYNAIEQSTMYLGLGAGSGGAESYQTIYSWSFTLNYLSQFNFAWVLPRNFFFLESFFACFVVVFFFFLFILLLFFSWYSLLLVQNSQSYSVPASALQLTGGSQLVSSTTGPYSLVVNNGGSTVIGNAFYSTPITFYQNGAHLDLSISFSFTITSCTGGCADGFTFIVSIRSSFFLLSSFFFLLSSFFCHLYLF
jgi:hypothetical protein